MGRHGHPADTVMSQAETLWSVGRESGEYAHLACTTVHLA
jgi:hypothetical protein